MVVLIVRGKDIMASETDLISLIANRLRPLEGNRASKNIKDKNIKTRNGTILEHKNAPIGHSPTGAYTASEHDTTTGYGHMIARQIKDKKGKVINKEWKVGSQEWWDNLERHELDLKSRGIISQDADLLELDSQNAENLFKYDISSRQKDLNSMLKDYSNYPKNLQVELSQSHYRGDIKSDHNFVKLMNSGKFKKAKKEFLNNRDYKKYKKAKAAGKNNNIVGRFEATEKALQDLIDQRKNLKVF